MIMIHKRIMTQQLTDDHIEIKWIELKLSLLNWKQQKKQNCLWSQTHSLLLSLTS